MESFNVAINSSSSSQHSDEIKKLIINLCVKDLSFNLKIKPPSLTSLTQSKQEKQKNKIKILNILKNINLYVKPGHVLFILGPSGSGKTTLLNILAGRIKKTNMNEISGNIYINGISTKKLDIKQFSSYVMQKENMLDFLTVEETLYFNAALKLKSINKEKRIKRVDALISQLGLQDCKKNLVGGQFKKGISGGEMKRLSIAIELLDNPSLLFLDEPTSGLDASLAFDILNLLIKIAKIDQRTIICTVHQPRSQSFSMFDELLLLSKGECVFNGPSNETISYFSSNGFKCPSNFNPADFLLDLLTLSHQNESTFNFKDILSLGSQQIAQTYSSMLSSSLKIIDKIEKKSEEDTHETVPQQLISDTSPSLRSFSSKNMYTDNRHAITEQELNSLPLLFKNSKYAKEIENEINKSIIEDDRNNQQEYQKYKKPTKRYDWLRQIYFLSNRGILNSFRNPITNYARIGVNLFTAIILGGLFFDLDKYGRTNIVALNVFSCLFFLVANLSFSTFDSLLTFPQERAIFNRDSASGTYTTSAFYLAKTFSDFPFQIVGPLLFLLIFYWMAGLANTAQQFLLFLAIGLLNVYSAIGFMYAVGAVSPNLNVAQAVSPIFLVIFMLVSGFFLKEESIPGWISWLRYISFMKYTFFGFSVNQFPPGEMWGEMQNIYILKEIGGITETRLWLLMLLEFLLGTGYRLLAFILLKYTNRAIGLE